MEGSAPSEPAPPPPPLLLFSPPASFSLALPPPRTLRRREGELPGVLRGELLAVLEIKREEKNKTFSRGEKRGNRFTRPVNLSCRAMKKSCRRFSFDDKTPSQSAY